MFLRRTVMAREFADMRRASGLGGVEFQARGDGVQHDERPAQRRRRIAPLGGELAFDVGGDLDDLDGLLHAQHRLCDQAVNQAFDEQERGLAMRIRPGRIRGRSPIIIRGIPGHTIDSVRRERSSLSAAGA